MAEVLFYEHPVPLNRDAHKNLRIKPLSDLSFAANVHSVPITVGEFGAAARDFPVLFGGESIDQAGPLVMLGLDQSENLYVDDEGHWEEGAYAPAFIRRYPFVLAEDAKDGAEPDFTVFLDEAYSGFSTEDGDRLFNDDGSDSDTLKNAVKFLGEFQRQVKLTSDFTQRVRELGLLVERSIQIKDSHGANARVVNGLFVIDEDKLRKLDAKIAHELLGNGALGWAFAHLVSLGNVDRLIQRWRVRHGSLAVPAGNA